MSGLLPSEPDIEDGEGEPRVIGVDSDDADQLLAALSSTTARKLLAVLHDEPATPSELADAVDTSLQNAQYHIGKLEDADLIEVRGTRYSEKGREMNVYGPTDRPLVVFAGTEDQSQGVKTALTRLLGAVGILGLASLLVQQLFGGGVGLPFGAPDGTGGDGGTDFGAGGAADTTTEAAAGATRTATETVQQATRTTVDGNAATTVADSTGAAGAALGLPPGLAFFAGGLLVVALGASWWYLRR